VELGRKRFPTKTTNGWGKSRRAEHKRSNKTQSPDLAPKAWETSGRRQGRYSGRRGKMTSQIYQKEGYEYETICKTWDQRKKRYRKRTIQTSQSYNSTMVDRETAPRDKKKLEDSAGRALAGLLGKRSNYISGRTSQQHGFLKTV